MEEIPEYLRNITGGRPLPGAVVREVEHRYSLIGRSPLTEITLRQAEAVARESGLPVYVGMRNWRPLHPRHRSQDGRGRHYACGRDLPGAAQLAHQCRALSPRAGSAAGEATARAQRRRGSLPFTIDFVESWHDHPLLIEAFAERLRQGWKRACAEAGGRCR